MGRGRRRNCCLVNRSLSCMEVCMSRVVHKTVPREEDEQGARSLKLGMRRAGRRWEVCWICRVCRDGCPNRMIWDMNEGTVRCYLVGQDVERREEGQEKAVSRLRSGWGGEARWTREQSERKRKGRRRGKEGGKRRREASDKEEERGKEERDRTAALSKRGPNRGQLGSHKAKKGKKGKKKGVPAASSKKSTSCRSRSLFPASHKASPAQMAPVEQW